MVSQVALSLVLVVGALLFSGSLRKLLAVDAGFRRTGVLVSRLDLRRLKLPTNRRVDFKRDLLQRIRALPGVTSAAEVAFLPLSGASTANAVWKEEAPDQKFDSNFDAFGVGYLKTMGMTLLAGRDFTDHDTGTVRHIDAGGGGGPIDCRYGSGKLCAGVPRCPDRTASSPGLNSVFGFRAGRKSCKDQDDK